MDNCRGYIFLSDTSADDEAMDGRVNPYFANNEAGREQSQNPLRSGQRNVMPIEPATRSITNSAFNLPDLVAGGQNEASTSGTGNTDQRGPHRAQSSNWPSRGIRNEQFLRLRNARFGIGTQMEVDGRFSPRDTGNPTEQIAATLLIAHTSNSHGSFPRTQNNGVASSNGESGNQAQFNGDQGDGEGAPSTRIEDDVLNSIQELRSQYIYQYTPAFQLDLNEQFGIAMNRASNRPAIQVPPPAVSNELSSRIRALRLASEQTLIRLRHQTNLPDSDVTSSDAEEAVPVPAAYANQAQPSSSSTIGVSVSFTPPGSDDPLVEIAQLEEMSSLTDGLRKTLQILQRALSMQLESNVQISGGHETAPMVATAAQQFQSNALEAINRERIRIARFNQTLATTERPDTRESNYSNTNFELDFNVWDAETTMNNLGMFNGESDTSEEDYGGRQDNVVGFGSLSALHALYNAATRETGTSTRDSGQDAATVRERARERGRRPAFQVPRNVSPDTREFYRSIGLPSGEGDPGRNFFNDFIAMSNPRSFTDDNENLLGKHTPAPLYDSENSIETNHNDPDGTQSSENEMYEDGTESDWEGDSDVEDVILPDASEFSGTMNLEKITELIGDSSMGMPSYLSGLPTFLPKVELDEEDEHLQKFLDEFKRGNDSFEVAVTELMGLAIEIDDVQEMDFSSQSDEEMEPPEKETKNEIIPEMDDQENPFELLPGDTNQSSTLEDEQSELLNSDVKKESNLKVLRNRMSTCFTNMKNCATALAKK